MKNALTNHDHIANVIEFAVNQGSGYAASEAASTIDKEFILIKKSDLPSFGLSSMTTGYNSVNGSQTYWESAFKYIATALHAEQVEAKQAERELDGMRKEAYNMLFPTAAPLYTYKSAHPEVKSKIDVVVNLMRQVDELKATK